MEKLLTIEGLAELLEVPVGTVYQWNSRGGGPRPVKVGRHVRYRPEDVRQWLEERATKGPVSAR